MSWALPQPYDQLQPFQRLSDYNRAATNTRTSWILVAFTAIFIVAFLPFLFWFWFVLRFNVYRLWMRLTSKGPNEIAQYDLIPDERFDPRVLLRLIREISSKGLNAHGRGGGAIAQWRNKITGVDPNYMSLNPQNVQEIWEILPLPDPVPNERLLVRHDMALVVAEALSQAVSGMDPVHQRTSLVNALTASGLVGAGAYKLPEHEFSPWVKAKTAGASYDF